ncbi:MAG: hypothetical protein HZA66_18125 [Rhodopseudomonas palustris]|uniref:Uncharacterized protein n=1 Tax=Rhodopseudomonas palustris TaxID=1076 RepID=A0A933S3H7_RHOPL|nr:hypothetical protein [Rhodopseudomonas palustris]
MVGEYILSIDVDEGIRQGDVIRSLPIIGETPVRYGFIVTADCDIAQNKAGDSFTLLDIVPAAQYLDLHWAPQQLRRIIERQSRVACESPNGKISRSSAGLAPLEAASLQQWLAETTPESIVNSVQSDDQKLLSLLACIRLALGHGSSGSRLADLRQV